MSIAAEYHGCRSRQCLEGVFSRRRTYRCRKCDSRFQVDCLNPLPEEDRLCQVCQGEQVVKTYLPRNIWLTNHILKSIHQAYDLSLVEDEDFIVIQRKGHDAYVFTRYAETSEILKAADELVEWAQSGVEFYKGDKWIPVHSVGIEFERGG
jgi:hypothetical protein